jgi:DNA-binding NtrC family response regulator
LTTIADADHGTVASVPLETARRVASTDTSLLITGETGVGKGYFARWIHEHSSRRHKPFVPLNCGAMPGGIIDSHLFGHVRGSFSDAHRDHQGLVRAAEGGTLFLDEVGELPLEAQIRLLRLLEEREIQPVGSMRPTRVNVRIIAATARNLAQVVEDGEFREDLYYRLNVIQFHLLPLRERASEVPGLVDAFNRDFAHRLERPPLQFSRQALQLLLRSPWPGNVRQLRTVIERLHVLCPVSIVETPHLREYGQLGAVEPGPRVPPMKRMRVRVVREAVAACNGNISRAAESLGVHRSTVHRWLARECVSV